MIYAPEIDTPAPPRARTGWCATLEHPPAPHRELDSCSGFVTEADQ